MPSMQTMDSQPGAGATLSSEQKIREEQLREVGELLLGIEETIRRVQRTRFALEKGGAEANFLVALERAASDLEKVRRHLHQDTYLAGSQQSMF